MFETKGQSLVYNLGHWNLSIVWDLEFGAWGFIGNLKGKAFTFPHAFA